MQYLEYKESKARGSFGFPIEIYHLSANHPRYEMPYHWHAECEIIRILEGQFAYTIEEESGIARPGDILFVNSGFLHAGVPNGCRYECIVFDANTLLRPGGGGTPYLLGFNNHQLLVWHRLPQGDAILRPAVEGLFSALTRKQPGYQLVTQGLLLQVFGQIIQGQYYIKNKTDKQGTQRKIGQLKKALEFIEENYASPVTLGRLAEVAGLAPKYFCQFFVDMTGRTPMDYVNYHRVEVACLQLAAGQQNITEISYECGFNDLSYFIRVFKRYKGTTPKQYAKQQLAA